MTDWTWPSPTLETFEDLNVALHPRMKALENKLAGVQGDLSINNVKDFGALGDGITDDTTAVQAAIDDAPSGGWVYIPPTATAYIVSNLTITKSLTLIGGGWGMSGQARDFGQASELIAATTPQFSGSRLRAKAGATGYLLTVGPYATTSKSYQGQLEAVRIENLYLDGNARSPDMGGLDLHTVEQSNFSNLKIEHFLREGLRCFTAVRESTFSNVFFRYCGDSDNSFPCINLHDQDVNSQDANNLLFFDRISCVYHMGDAVLLDTVATKTRLTRDIFFDSSTFHGVDTDIDGFPYTLTTAQKKTTIFQMKSATNLRIAHSALILAGIEPANFVHEANGSHATGPSVLSLIGVELRGRYDGTGSPRIGIWIENGDLLIEGCSIESDDTSNILTASGTNLYYGSANRTGASITINGTIAGNVIAQTGLFVAGTRTAEFRGSDTDTYITIKNTKAGGREFNLAVGATGSGNGVGFYLYDVTAGARRWFVDANGKLHLNGALGVAGVFSVGAVTLLATDATPSVAGGNLFQTDDTTTITDFDDGIVGQTIKILSAHSKTITDNAAIILSGGANFNMVASDTLTLTMFTDQIWQEVSRSVN